MGDVGEDVLILSCVWHPTMADLLAVTTSTGQVRLLHTQPTGKPGPVSVLLATHLAEAWTVAIAPKPSSSGEHPVRGEPQRFTVYSGGDDSAAMYMCCSLDGETQDGQARDGPAEDDPARGDGLPLRTLYPPARIKGHTAGVTSILPLPLRLRDGAEIVVTGSYDDYIRVYAIQHQAGPASVSRARSLAEENLGGGVWRLKLLDIATESTDELLGSEIPWMVDLLVSCMHAGVRLLRILGDGDGDCRIRVVARFQEHRSMNYGSDFQPVTGSGERLCVSTSFYDRLLCLWPLVEDEK